MFSYKKAAPKVRCTGKLPCAHQKKVKKLFRAEQIRICEYRANCLYKERG